MLRNNQPLFEMAKTPAKTQAAKTATKTVAKPKATAPSILKATEEALAALKAADLDPQLQADIEWCLGSFNADNNPAGLYEMTQKAIFVFMGAKEKKTKGVTTKLITDLEKAVQSRQA